MQIVNLYRIRLIELRACRNVIIYHQKMEFLFLAAPVDCGKKHAAGIDAHHRSGRQIRNGNQRFPNQLLRLIECMDAGEDGALRAGAIVQGELQKLSSFVIMYSEYSVSNASFISGSSISTVIPVSASEFNKTRRFFLFPYVFMSI